MKNIECLGSGCPARPYCDALAQQGVEVKSSSSDCTIPNMFIEESKGDISFMPTDTGDLRNPELVGRLGAKILEELTNDKVLDINSPEVSTLLDSHNEVFSARMNLWNSMLEATREGRKLTDIERIYYEDKLRETIDSASELTNNISANTDAIIIAQAIFDHNTLKEHGLLFDDSMISTVDRLVGNLMDGKPALIVGEKGVAKTQSCKFVAKLWDPKNEPLVISGHGDMTSSEFMGQIVQDKETGRFVYKYGKLVQAMKEGRPIILDEVNVGDQPVMLRLQDLLLQRPGKQVTIQENGYEEIGIQPGFVVYATANEASEHYQHRNTLESAFRDRYDLWKLGYTDISKDNPLDNTPASLMRLALAASVNAQGRLSPHVEMSDLNTLVKLANITQHLFTRPARDVKNNKLQEHIGSTTNYLDDSTVMSDCITPRSVYDTVTRCALGNKPGFNLGAEIERLISGLDQSKVRNSQMAYMIIKLFSDKSGSEN